MASLWNKLINLFHIEIEIGMSFSLSLRYFVFSQPFYVIIADVKNLVIFIDKGTFSNQPNKINVIPEDAKTQIEVAKEEIISQLSSRVEDLRIELK